MKRLLTLTAVIEAATGAGLLATPVLVVQLLIGAEIAGVAVPLGRIAGAALLALGIACWLARGNGASRPLIIAMAISNVAAVVVLGSAGFQFATAGALLWLVVLLHAAMAIWCAALLARRPNPVP
jgi:hypothetical protein